jgi:hypothetical protein
MSDRFPRITAAAIAEVIWPNIANTICRTSSRNALLTEFAGAWEVQDVYGKLAEAQGRVITISLGKEPKGLPIGRRLDDLSLRVSDILEAKINAWKAEYDAKLEAEV